MTNFDPTQSGNDSIIIFSPWFPRTGKHGNSFDIVIDAVVSYVALRQAINFVVIRMK